MTRVEFIKKFDERYTFLIKKAEETKTTPAVFSKSDEIKKVAFELVDLLEQNGDKTTFNNLTNMNHHLLIKILNYNDFFKKTLTKKLQEELKEVTFWK